MHIFAQNQKSTMKAKSASSTRPVRAFTGQSREASSILPMQRRIGNQAVHRLLQTNVEELEVSATSTASPHFAHDFSRIPLHANARTRLQAKLTVNAQGDIYEQEADRIADQVLCMPEPKLQRACACGGGRLKRRKEKGAHEQLRTKRVQALGTRGTEVPPSVHEVLRSAGQPMDAVTRTFFEPRFGHDFSQVRVHTGTAANETTKAVNAKALTVGKNIVFGAGEYSPASSKGRRLLAHELTHVVQQNQRIAPSIIQRQCSDPEFCTAYATTAEAVSEEAWLRTYFLPSMNLKFGTEVHDLWESFLSRAPGASLTRRVFATASNPIEESFATSSAVEDDQEAVLDLVVSRLSRFPGGRLRPHAYTVVSLTNFLSASEMNDRPINFSNPFSKAGNIAGGIGSSAAGPDFRKIARANVVLEKIPLIGNSGYIYFKLVPLYEVYDAVDLCPGQCGSPAEQIFTIPLSRLEAMGRAFDVPYVVKFQPEPETRREPYANLPL